MACPSPQLNNSLRKKGSQSMTQPKTKRIMTPEEIALAERLSQAVLLEVTSRAGVKEGVKEQRECNTLINKLDKDRRARVFFEAQDLARAAV